jgi:uncharacterized protein (UPF0548 family)
MSSPPEGPINATIDHYQADVRITPEDTAAAVFGRIRDSLFAYDMFPPWLIHHAFCPPEPLREGTTIVQRVILGPIALEMAVRVIAAWDRHDGSVHEAGFTYATVAGHAERGVATFQVRWKEGRDVNVLIDARSCPGTLLTRLGRPAARLFQRAITIAALRRLACF